MSTGHTDGKPGEEIAAQLAVKYKAERDHWKSAFELFREHRLSCAICGNSNPLCGPHCAEGRQLRNNAIDEGSLSDSQEGGL